MSALPALLAIMLEPEPVKPRALVAPPVKRSANVAAKQKPVPISTTAAPSEVKAPTQTNFRDEPLPGSSPVLPEERRFRHCTWPVREDGVHKLCALDRVPRKDGRLGNYCEEHARRSARRTDLLGDAFVHATMRWAVK